MIFAQLQQKKEMTFQERLIADYILSNPEKFLNETARELANTIHTSPSTISRFCKKLGYDNYPKFQLHFSREYSNKSHYNNEDNLADYSLQKAPLILDNLYQYVIQETKLMLNYTKLEQIISMMALAKKIDFYGSDGNYLALQRMTSQLNNIHISAQTYNSLNNIYIDNLNSDENISFIISHSGKNPAMLRIAYELRKRNIKTIALTNQVEKSLEKICDESLYIFSSDEHSKIGSMQWGISLNYLLDLLYLCLLNEKEIE
ncbi:MurR/RpiR family transcriptional regulator [Oceanobacillus oncorhynchi subsp. oncorhynchi]|uniref:MurR/RpiR family transcriptional regulator n=1 Tax=Oceanobacillus oncorhynchi TaxID=545501 RepID=UPI0031D15A1F